MGFAYFTNLHQKPDERRLKYALCRMLGEDNSTARQHRDWRWNKIARMHGFLSMNRLNISMKDEIGFDFAEIIPNWYLKNGKRFEETGLGIREGQSTQEEDYEEALA